MECGLQEFPHALEKRCSNIHHADGVDDPHTYTSSRYTYRFDISAQTYNKIYAVDHVGFAKQHLQNCSTHICPYGIWTGDLSTASQNVYYDAIKYPLRTSILEITVEQHRTRSSRRNIRECSLQSAFLLLKLGRTLIRLRSDADCYMGPARTISIKHTNGISIYYYIDENIQHAFIYICITGKLMEMLILSGQGIGWCWLLSVLFF